jgi:hypothetical protein
MTRVGDFDEQDEEEIRRLRDSTGREVPADWQPSPETLRTIWGEGEALRTEEVVDVECFTDAPEMRNVLREEFRQEMASMSLHERGAWGEQAVIEEAKARGHRVLSEHAETATTPGYDCVSWDAHIGTLHVWEAKNYSWDEQTDRCGVAQSAGAWEAEKALPNVEKFLNDLPLDDPERKMIIQALDKNQAEWHLRLGPDTDFASALNPPGRGLHDIRRYAYGYMLRLRPP